MRAALGRNVVANMLSAASGIAASLISLPIILPAVGAAGYGVWTIGLSFILYLTIADGGFGPAVQRWTALSKDDENRREASRLLWTTLLLYGILGMLAMVALVVAAPAIVSLFDFPADLRADAQATFQLVGVALLITLLLAAIGNVLQGLERFVAIGLSTAAGSVGYLVAIAVLMAADRGIVGLALATLIQQGITLVGRVWAVRDVALVARPALVPWPRLREMAIFSAKLQAAVFSWLINSQSDKVVMGLVGSAATLGQLGIASQLADAGRLVAGAALAPVMTSLAVSAAADPERLRSHFGWSHRVWVDVILGGTLVGLGALYPLLAAWLGSGYGEAAMLGAFLVAGMGAALAPGVAIGYLRAVGRPGVEGRYGLVMVGLNFTLTVPLALLFGPFGVVAGTCGAYVLAAAWLLRRFAVEAPQTDRPRASEMLRPAMLGVLAGSVAAGGGIAAVELLPQGIALPPAAAVASLAYAAYLSAVTGRPLTVAGMRALVGGLRQPA